MSHMGQPPLPPIKNQGHSASSAAVTEPPIQADYPHDTFKAHDTPLLTTSIVKPGDGTGSGGAKVVNKVPPRCGY